MNQYLKHHEWKIIEDKFYPEYNRASESIFSIGNGRMGQRANFEEEYSGDSLKGNYIGGIYYPDKTKVGWWKNGYPEYYAKVLNAPNWIGIKIKIDGETLDLAKCKVENFTRTLNMKEGFLRREFEAVLPGNKKVKVDVIRFYSIVHDETGTIKYEITPLNFSGKMEVTFDLDADVINEDANYNEKFWDEVGKTTSSESKATLTSKTKKLDFHVCLGMEFQIYQNNEKIRPGVKTTESKKYIAKSVTFDVKENDSIKLYKYASIISSFNYDKAKLTDEAEKQLDNITNIGFEDLLKAQSEAWKKKWEDSDIVIKGDIAAQQGIRFNIFMLHQTYTGEDERLNIGPKGFTGEKYGGSTYWDTEAYCLPFYLRTSEPKTAKNLLLYRYKHLEKAIENAQRLGFSKGAALYPMVTMNGEESHNEWEITFEEIHRNGAIAFAIHRYIRYTGDDQYLNDYGLEVLIAISRFWKQRVNWSEPKQKYVMLGVTGPNEYENNVNNNWYTNLIASWTMEYTMYAIDKVKRETPDKYKKIAEKHNFNDITETNAWREIVENMYFPYDNEKEIYLQQEGYLDKEQLTVEDIPDSERPINQVWSWDRILRSCLIKQADVLQGLYFLEDRYDIETIRRNYDFYEAKTVHESSLSPCVHSILAAKLGYREKAYNLYLRTARLDLDDYNNEVNQGCHVTSMAGTYMSIVEGFGGMRIKNDELHFNPFIPEQWELFSYIVKFRGRHIKVEVEKEKTTIYNQTGDDIKLYLFDKEYEIKSGKSITAKNL
ncbi:MAG: family 65 glycosyl hydrolase domain-containing protein [Bacteroidota bacterium]